MRIQGVLHDSGGAYQTSLALGINNEQQIVGFVRGPGTTTSHAVQWKSDKVGFPVRDLHQGFMGTFSEAQAINGSGSVVGNSSCVPGTIFPHRAFLYDGAQVMDLNDLIDPASGWALQRALDIKESGRIVRAGIDPEGVVNRGCVLVPDE